MSLGKKVLFSGLTLCLFFVLLEGALWIFGFRSLDQKDDLTRGFSGLRTVFEKRGDRFHTRPSQGFHTFNPQSFLAEKPANGLRIFCLGGSSSYGFPFGADVAFTGVLGDWLHRCYPDKTVEAINVSGVSYAMHRLEIVARELVDYEPDIFLIYSGHNEFVETSFFSDLKDRNQGLNRVQSWLSHLRTYTALHDLIQSSASKPMGTRERFKEYVRRETRVFDDGEKKEVIAHFHEALSRVASIAQDRGIKVALATVPCNLRDWGPMKSASSIQTMDDRIEFDSCVSEGRLALTRHSIDEADTLWQRAITLDPGHAETHFLQGRVKELKGAWKEAASAYSNACDLDASPIRRVSGINEAIIRVAHENPRIALIDVEEHLTKKSEHGLIGFNWIEDYVHPTIAAHQEIAFLYHEGIEKAGWLENQQPSREHFDAWVKERPVPQSKNNATWFFNQGVLLEAQGSIREAALKYRDAVRIDPNYVAAQTNLGSMLNQLGRFDEAIEALERAIALDPEDVLGRVNLGDALRKSGEPQRALEQYRHALNLDPNYIAAMNNMGIAFQDVLDIKSAIAQYRRVLALDPQHPDASHNLGRALLAQEDVDAAIVHLETALVKLGGSPESLELLALAYQKKGRDEESLRLLLRAHSISDDRGALELKIARCLMRLSRPREAIEYFEAARQKAPLEFESLNNLGVAYQQIGRPSDAILFLQKALYIEPTAWDTRLNLGISLEAVQRYDEAMREYSAILESQPNHASARSKMGDTQMLQSNFEGAIKSYSLSLEINPERAETHFNLGVALKAVGRENEARFHFGEALRLNPNLEQAIRSAGGL